MSRCFDFDMRQFRDVLGVYATGVTIITTRAQNGEPLGVTVSSFNSVSLDPPMVLWSLAKSAYSRRDFESAKYWSVHVLADYQCGLADRFAKTGADKFADVVISPGLGDTPLLADCAARLQCRTAFCYEGGDHIILVGEVLAFEKSDDVAPLIFCRGKYAVATPKTENVE